MFLNHLDCVEIVLCSLTFSVVFLCDREYLDEFSGSNKCHETHYAFDQCELLIEVFKVHRIALFTH
ncbi:hypothetical protein D3C81_1654800 [compost metagenome]